MHRAGMPLASATAAPFLDSSALRASFALHFAVKANNLETAPGSRLHFLAAWAFTKCSAQGLGSCFSKAVVPRTPVLLRSRLNGESGVRSDFAFEAKSPAAHIVLWQGSD